MRMEIGFPANGRTIIARELEKILLISSFFPIIRWSCSDSFRSAVSSASIAVSYTHLETAYSNPYIYLKIIYKNLWGSFPSNSFFTVFTSFIFVFVPLFSISLSLIHILIQAILQLFIFQIKEPDDRTIPVYIIHIQIFCFRHRLPHRLLYSHNLSCSFEI